jgi:hypothetical protein
MLVLNLIISETVTTITCSSPARTEDLCQNSRFVGPDTTKWYESVKYQRDYYKPLKNIDIILVGSMGTASDLYSGGAQFHSRPGQR